MSFGGFDWAGGNVASAGKRSDETIAEGQMDARDGKHKGIVQVQVDNDQLTIKRIQAYEDAPLQLDDHACGLDQGASHALLITSDGEHHGQTFMTWLRDRDQELIALQKELGRRNIKLSTNKRYTALVQRIRSHTVNEVNRILNKLAARYPVLVLEKLDFRSQSLSRTLNRLLTRLGQAQLKLKLKMLREDQGTRAVHINASFSSQECSRCGLVRAANRSAKVHSCAFCGHASHSDVNASQVIRDRRSIPLMINSDYERGRGSVLAYLDERFLTRWGEKKLKQYVSDMRYAHAVGLASAEPPGSKLSKPLS